MNQFNTCMVGGGINSMIGSAHRIGAQYSGYFKLVAGAFSRDFALTQKLGSYLNLDKSRCYNHWKDMIRTEMTLQKGACVIIITTPDIQHYEQAHFALEHGMHVICDKPVTITAAEALQLRNLAKKQHLLFGVTYTQNGNPAFIKMKKIIRGGELGNIRMIRSHLFAPWAMRYVEGDSTAPMHKQAWRLKKEFGEAGALSDIGSHMFQYMHDISGLSPTSLIADLQIMVEERTSDDSANVLFHYSHYNKTLGVTGIMSTSLAMTSSTEHSSVEILGDDGGARVYIDAETNKTCLVINNNNKLHTKTFLGNNKKIIEYLDVGVSQDSKTLFSTIYAEYGKALDEGRATDFTSYPSIQHGYEGMVFIEKSLQSHHNRTWIPLLFE